MLSNEVIGKVEVEVGDEHGIAETSGSGRRDPGSGDRGLAGIGNRGPGWEDGETGTGIRGPGAGDWRDPGTGDSRGPGSGLPRASDFVP